MRTILLVFLAVAAALASACGGGGADAPACPEGTEPFLQYELFMGRSGDSGKVVGDAAWDAFLGKTVIRPGFLTALPSSMPRASGAVRTGWS